MKTRKRRHKLMIQMSIIAVLIFIVTLSYIIVSDYYITRNAYLSSKNEMMERDMKIMRNDLQSVPSLDWFLGYLEDHESDITRELTQEEKKIESSKAFEKYTTDLIVNKVSPKSDDDSLYQLLYARALYNIIFISMESRIQLNYSEINFTHIIDENNEYMICGVTQDTRIEDKYNSGLGYVFFHDDSENSSLKRLYSGELDNSTKIMYEPYYDSEDDKYYYIGYTSITTIGNDRYVESVVYDWTDYHGQLIKTAISSIITGFIILVVIYTALVLLLYFKAVSPIQKITSAILQYMEDKSSTDVSDKMDSIKVKNEIGVLAHSFSDLTTEIERHTSDILRLNGEKERMEGELSIAAKIQADALPRSFPPFPDRKEFDIYASMTPAKEVGGDFYDFFFIDQDHFAMVMADVSGKGVPAALFMMTAKTLIKNRAQMGEYSPSRILMDVNDQLYDEDGAGMFVTVWLAVIDLTTGKGMAANAGHEHPVLKRNGGKFEMIKYKHSPAVASIDSIRFKEHEFEMAHGDTVFMYTDGVPEANNKEDQLFGNERMIDALNIDPDASDEKLLKNVKQAVDEFVGDAPQFDDLTMLGFTYYGKEGKNDRA